MGMTTLSGLIAALLAAVAPSATATHPALLGAHVVLPAKIQVLRVATSEADKRTRTCNARGSNRQAGRVEKQLAPVACEQPPRSKVILTIDGGLFGSGR
jgi:hypothetical protein